MPEALHDARKDLKKTRAVLRLARSGVPKKDLRKISRLLRKAGRCLAPARDADVKTKTLARVSQHFKKHLPKSFVHRMDVNLRRQAADEINQFRGKKKGHAVEDLLRRAAKKTHRLTIQCGGWTLVAAGLKRTYAQGRAAFQTAVARPAPEHFHQWRKQVKDLWYQVSLLRPVWPKQIDAMADELETLGDLLGEDHDLFVLDEFLANNFRRHIDRRALKELQEHLEDRQQQLRGKAIALGQRVYVEKPTRFCRRLGVYWQAWRREKNHPSGGQGREQVI